MLSFKALRAAVLMLLLLSHTWSQLKCRPEKASKVKTLVFPTALHDPNMYDPKGKITAVPYKRCLDAGERVTWASKKVFPLCDLKSPKITMHSHRPFFLVFLELF